MSQNSQKLRKVGQGIQQGKKRTLTTQIDLSHIDPDYVGNFKFHHPTVFERMQIGVLKSQLLAGFEGKTDIMTDNIAHMTSALQVVVDSSPDWFNVRDMYDYEVLEGVYDTYIKWVDSFRKDSAGTDDAGDSKGAK
jgi:hypothetical protein